MSVLFASIDLGGVRCGVTATAAMLVENHHCEAAGESEDGAAIGQGG